MPKSFEELPVWQKARELVNYVYDLTKKEPFCRDFSLVDQIRRSSTSVMFNIEKVSNEARTPNSYSFCIFRKVPRERQEHNFMLPLTKNTLHRKNLRKLVFMQGCLRSIKRADRLSEGSPAQRREV